MLATTACMPFSAGAATLVPPTPPDWVPVAVLERKKKLVAVSAIAEMSGLTRPGHAAVDVTPAPTCHDGRAKRFEHQLPAPLHVVLVLHVEVLLVDQRLVPPTDTTYGLSVG